MAKRRANGEGSICKRKDGRWEGRYTAGRDPATEKPIYKNVLGKTQAAAKERLLLVNPAHGCKLSKIEKRELKILPQEKVGPYLMEADKRGLLAAFYLELTTGLRRGALLAPPWMDLDITNKTISVTKQVNRIKGELVVSRSKTQNSLRTLCV